MEQPVCLEACFETQERALKKSPSPEQNWFHETTQNGVVGAHISPHGVCIFGSNRVKLVESVSGDRDKKTFI